MSRPRQPPLVTGISPKEGTAWTKVTIRGENLGTGPTDLIGLSICGHNCMLTAEWMSASKIVCRVGPAKDDKGEIIVTTKSGGLGTSTVSFKLLKPERIGILEQSAVWVDEMNYDMRRDRNKGLSPFSLGPGNPLGIELDKGNVPQKDLGVIFPGMSGDFTSEKFSATWYLIENHAGTSSQNRDGCEEGTLLTQKTVTSGQRRVILDIPGFLSPLPSLPVTQTPRIQHDQGPLFGPHRVTVSSCRGNLTQDSRHTETRPHSGSRCLQTLRNPSVRLFLAETCSIPVYFPL
uniref:Exocyst complex component 2 n=1 Tax=Kryptolebias marmoratus TaxID=37003 RepID=A0A3Q3A8M6_KRYMA